MSQDKPVLFVLTSQATLGDSDRPTGFFYEEMAIPYWRLRDAGWRVTLASVRGGSAPIDPGSLEADERLRPAAVQRFTEDPDAVTALETTATVAGLDPDAFAGVFLPGGHGTLWDFPECTELATLVGRLFDLGRPVGAVCHGPAGLVNARRSDGYPIVHGRRVNSFSNAEEQAVGLADTVPFLLADRLAALGGAYEHGPQFEAYAVRDGHLVTGQNPASSPRVAELMLAALTGD